MSELEEKTKNKNTYFLRTQSTILKGKQNIPFNSLKPKLKYKKSSLSKNKNSKSKRPLINFSTGNKPTKSKKYIKGKKHNIFSTSCNYGGIDLNKVSGTSHSPNLLSRSMKNFLKNIVPYESNGFSIHGSMGEPEPEGETEIKNNIKDFNDNVDGIKDINYNDNDIEIKSIINEDESKNDESEEKKLNKNIYNSKLYTPFYDLIDNIKKKSCFIDMNKNSDDNKMSKIDNNKFLNSNNVIEINKDDKNNNKNNKKIKIKSNSNNNINRKINEIKNNNNISIKSNNKKISNTNISSNSNYTYNKKNNSNNITSNNYYNKNNNDFKNLNIENKDNINQFLNNNYNDDNNDISDINFKIKNNDNKNNIYEIDQKYFNDINQNMNIELTKIKRREENESYINNYINRKKNFINSPPLNNKSFEYFSNPKEDKKDSIISKVPGFIRDNKNTNEDNYINNYKNQKYKDFNNNIEKENLSNNYFENNNNYIKNNYNDYNNLNNYQSNDKYNEIKKLSYHDNNSKNNIIKDDINKDDFINKENYSMNNMRRNYDNIDNIDSYDTFNININNINNSKYQLNSMRDNYNNYNLNSNIFSKKTLNHYDTHNNIGNSNLPSKYFLKSVFDQNDTNQFIKDFNIFSKPKSKNNTISVSNFNFENINNEKEPKKYSSSFFNMHKNENKLEKLLKEIPRHNKEKIYQSYNYVLSKVNSDNNNTSNDSYSYTYNRKSKAINEENQGIMPANILLHE